MMHRKPNPQGKGTPGVLATLESHRRQLASIPAKPIDQVATELFTSLFILGARFRFKPVPGNNYYLYCQSEPDGSEVFQLCLTPPQMLAESVGGRFIGACVLQPDMTWTLDLAPAVAGDTAFMATLAERRAVFENRLDRARSVDEILPVYERGFSFYRRACGFALAFSLTRSMRAAGISGLSYREARGLLGHAGASRATDADA